MTEQIAVSGLVATTPREVVTSDGLAITSFRLASSKRRFDRSTGNWVDAETNWFSVVAFRHLAKNMASSISKGDRVVLFGKLKVRDWDNGERSGTAVEIEAISIGHDLMFGVSSFVRVKPNSEEVEEVEDAQEDSEAELQPA